MNARIQTTLDQKRLMRSILDRENSQANDETILVDL